MNVYLALKLRILKNLVAIFRYVGRFGTIMKDGYFFLDKRKFRVEFELAEDFLRK